MTTGVRQPATEDDIRFVLNNLWIRGEEEFRRLGLNKEDAFKRFTHCVQTGFCSGTYPSVGEPIFVSGINRDGFSWFIATEGFKKHALNITNVIRGHIKQFNGEVFILSVLVHDEALKWFEILGFEQDKEYKGMTKAGFPLFKFQIKKG